MLTPDDIIKALSADRTKGFVDRLSQKVRDENFDINQLIDLTFHKDEQTGFRAAWLLDTTLHAEPERYADDLPYFITRMADVTYPSCQRHYTRVLLSFTDKKAPDAIRKQIAALDMEPVVEKCFDWLIDPKVKVAVKAFAAEILYNLSPRYDWIKDELVNQLHFMMRDGTAAIQVRGRKLLSLIQN
ncbi:hypothetical protein D0C36_00435 [Mucilaginibacter conchicola]|uniref:HEAT repeat domain-containing protein n=1 Tax=Mucilaginibacter conchicola TaxID=2303333 RepID=A0A372NV74_9SPHI|nr:hypothetical protein [Mucilaginibacter conchicola]RFZ94063.1 hypothetical protein D0C36_00435 [Mucilaginibacter conchicola]